MESHEYNREQHENLLTTFKRSIHVALLWDSMQLQLTKGQKKAFVYVKALTQLLVYSLMSITEVEQEFNVCFETETTTRGLS